MTTLRPTPYKVSTITATASFSCEHIDALTLFGSVCIELDTTKNGFSFVEYGEKKGALHMKGFHKKLLVTRRRRKETKRFDNQVTVLIRICTNFDGQLLPVIENTNMKVFRNGNIQMTGLKTIDQGHRAMDFMVNHIRNSEMVITHDISKLSVQQYEIRLINSDFSVGFDIKRDKLHKIIQEQYECFSTYEPCIYPGVKIQYNFNKLYTNTDGVCHCTKKCIGKGNALGDGQCKKITIAVFQSGCIIITGARSHEQVDAAYKYVCDIIEKHLDTVKKLPFNES
jgi:TATA-box binding protein (TBP) (component of TFIID and TFIIIB)